VKHARTEIVTIAEQVVYENAYARVWDDLVRFPDGHEGTYFRWTWKAPHGVAIIPLIGDSVLMLRSYRYQEQAFVLELPQGFGTEDSTPVEDAQRELLEETGLHATNLEHVVTLGSTWATHVFLARFAAGARPFFAGQEPTECIDGYCFWPVANISLARLAAADVTDATTLIGMLALKEVI